jgi:hypothetical protein
MGDYEAMVAQVRSADEGHRAEALQLVMALIALLDGARAVGLDVGREEREVNALLERLDAPA